MKNRDNIKLDQVISTIINEMGNVNIYHLNKLVYLFEFLFIKNFGMRYSGEQFIKLPHGPVISDYKKKIEKLFNEGLLNTDLSVLKQKRRLEDDYNIKIELKKTDKTQTISIKQSMILDFLMKIISKFGHLKTTELEKEVYNTKPVKEYIKKSGLGFKKEIGGYILSDCVKISEYKNSKTLGRKLALEHLKKYPEINIQQYRTYEEEFSSLKKLRPAWE